MNTEKVISGKLNISIQGDERLIRIGKKVVATIGNPDCICLRVSEEYDSLAILPCEANDYMSFPVPPGFREESGKKFRIYSKSFIQDFLTLNGLSGNKSYVLNGSYSKSTNAVIFPASAAVEMKRIQKPALRKENKTIWICLTF